MGPRSKGLSVFLTIVFTLVNILGLSNFALADDLGTWDNPYTVAQAITIQDNSIGSVQGYIVGQPTATNTVITENFPSDYAIAIADTPNETNTQSMLYVQIGSSFRADFGLKSNPGNMGSLVKVTGNLSPYFTPHQGLKSITRIEKVTSSEQIAVTGITLDPPELSLQLGETATLTATVVPENATNKNVTWASDKPEIADVSSGTVTAKAPGTAVITVTTEDNAKTATCTVKVSAATVDTTAPQITNCKPADASSGNPPRPLIHAEYADPSGIDVASIKLLIDGVDVRDLATITDTAINYTPQTDLSTGEHSVSLEVWDKAASANKQVVNWNFTVGAIQYNWYFGQLHSHTNLSDGQGTPDDAFTWARDQGKADFFAVTDHSNWFDNDTKATLTDGSASKAWQQLKQTADRYNQVGKFVAIAGYEMTWSGSTGGWGHINTFNTNGFETRNRSSVDLKTYYSELAALPNSISQLNHPGTTFGDFADFSYYTPAADAVVNLIEVGNGEGAVRSSGYFPSYDYYTRALDRGWHLAPTNNQDNHLGGWVTANDARTVVLAPTLSRDSVYNALKDMRVYATEDKDLKLMYKVNDQIMGSNLTNPTTLSFDISFEDAEASDTISKVSLIADGGKVVAAKDFAVNKGSWQLQLKPEYSYYYLRVEETDQDTAVTAPVWTGNVVPVGISKVEVSQDPQLVNNPVDITASIYNNGTNPLTNAKVEFFQNSIDLENKIGEQIISSIDAASTGSTHVTWTPVTAGNYKIYAQMTVNLDGVDKVCTASTTLDVANPGEVTKVVIDGGHQNQYVTGNYANKISTLSQMMKDKKFMLVQNNDELTAADLQNTKLLIITDPQSKDDTKYNLTKSNYTSSEIQVIKDFVDNGGSLIITSRADYDDKGVTDPSYQSAAQGNAILQAIGSNLRFNDDEVIDDVSNGGQNYRLYFDDYASNKYNLTNNIPLEETYSAYSGCSVLLKDGGLSENVDWLVNGHTTTGSLDSDLQNDATPVALGQVHSLAAEMLPSGSKLIVAGSTFFSDFETAAVDNAYANKLITDNILTWTTKSEPPVLKSIAEVRVDANQDGIPDLLGHTYSVEGTVTAQSKAVGSNTAFFDVIYVQDATGGLTVFGVSTRAIPLGAKVRVTGKLGQYQGDSQIQIANEDTDIQIIDSNPVMVEPKSLSTADAMLETNEGWLVRVQGVVKGLSTTNGDNSLYLDDGSGIAKVYVNGYIGDGTDNADMLGQWDKSIKVGDTVSAIGLASEDSAGHRLRVRNTAEIIKLQVAVTGILLDKSYLTLKKGAVAQLNATIQPANASNQQLIWASDNPQVATVDGAGKVSAVGIGTTKVTVTTRDGGFSSSCNVAVVKTPVKSVRLNKHLMNLRVGNRQTLLALIAPNTASVKDVVWNIDHPELVTVDKTNGKLTVVGAQAGIATITVTTLDGGYSDSCQVTVTSQPSQENLLAWWLHLIFGNPPGNPSFPA